MAKTAAVLIAPGCEEVEALSSVDVLRRAGIKCDMVGLVDKIVNGDHNIVLTCDKVLDESLLDYDMVIFPGGLPGAESLRDSETLRHLMVKRQEAGKWNAAMCAAPIAFARYGLLDGSHYTLYPGMEAGIADEVKDGIFEEGLVVVDEEKHLVTSRGPATAWAYAYEIAQILGADVEKLKDGMLYNMLLASR
ncbi:DJ-1 family glyoxalase III [Ligilactobacillus faecis]|uniref:DJ-1 family glyoxalase III n=1 Tax=Ligilactobacillus faecis TaxID=762833 RepID=A0ABV4DSH6_9LACO|nr:DJ-1 family glyoxalase III [Ligilactobacillus faecis]WGN90248.1 DJ-1/PfpI family protein [Ligilactobacillus faecis]